MRDAVEPGPIPAVLMTNTVGGVAIDKFVACTSKLPGLHIEYVDTPEETAYRFWADDGEFSEELVHLIEKAAAEVMTPESCVVSPIDNVYRDADSMEKRESETAILVAGQLTNRSPFKYELIVKCLEKLLFQAVDNGNVSNR